MVFFTSHLNKSHNVYEIVYFRSYSRTGRRVYNFSYEIYLIFTGWTIMYSSNGLCRIFFQKKHVIAFWEGEKRQHEHTFACKLKTWKVNWTKCWISSASHTKYIRSPVLCFIYRWLCVCGVLCIIYNRLHTKEIYTHTHFVAEHIPVIWLIYVALRVVLLRGMAALRTRRLRCFTIIAIIFILLYVLYVYHTPTICYFISNARERDV